MPAAMPAALVLWKLLLHGLPGSNAAAAAAVSAAASAACAVNVMGWLPALADLQLPANPAGLLSSAPALCGTWSARLPCEGAPAAGTRAGVGLQGCDRVSSVLLDTAAGLSSCWLAAQEAYRLISA